MRVFLESLSLTSGAIIVALSSAALVCLFSSLLPKRLNWFWVVIVPLALAHILYWSPVWLGADRSEYTTWAGLCVGTWLIAGAVPSAVIILILRKRNSSKAPSES